MSHHTIRMQSLFSGCLIVLFVLGPQSEIFSQTPTDGKRPVYINSDPKQTNDEAGRVRLQQAGSKQQRPVAKPMRVELSPELEYVLKTWEQQGKSITRLEGKHLRFVYDFTFNIEKRAKGEFYYVAPDMGRLDVHPVKVKEGTVNNKGPRGKKFDVKDDNAEVWISDGHYVSAINVARREYQKLEIPPEGRGKNIVDGPLPFLFGISVEKAKARYRMMLHTNPDKGGMHNLKKGIVHLLIYPLWRQDAANWIRAEVLLDAKTFLPSAIKLIHPGGTSETVYTFYDVKKNQKRSVFAYWKTDPFHPNLKSFKQLKMKMEQPKGTAKSLPPEKTILK